MQRTCAGGPRPLTARLLAVLLCSALLAAVGATQPASAVTAALQLTVASNVGEFHSQENIAVTGYLRTPDGSPLGGRTVYVQRKSGAGWVTLATTTTLDSGHYRLWVRNDASFSFRTYAKAASGFGAAASRTLDETRLSGGQTLEQRYAQVAPWLKAPTSKVNTGHSNGSDLRWRSYEKGMLVESAGRTFMVTGAVLAGYLKAGGPAGRLGAPRTDADCFRTLDKCLQAFAGGSVFYNRQSVTKATTHVAYGAGVASELIVVAASQVGYVEPGVKINKYNDWNGRNVAWCGVFLSWVSAIGNNGEAVPQVHTFASLVDEVTSRGVSSTPKLGALVFMTFNGGTDATHVGIVTKVLADGRVETIEGNTVITGGSDARVVTTKMRTPSQIRYYYYPGT